MEENNNLFDALSRIAKPDAAEAREAEAEAEDMLDEVYEEQSCEEHS